MDKDIGSPDNALKMRRLQQRLRQPECIPAEEAMHMVELAEGGLSALGAEVAVFQLLTIRLRNLLQLSQQEKIVVVGQASRTRFPRKAAGQLGRGDRGRGRDCPPPLQGHLNLVEPRKR